MLGHGKEDIAIKNKIIRISQKQPFTDILLNKCS